MAFLKVAEELLDQGTFIEMKDKLLVLEKELIRSLLLNKIKCTANNLFLSQVIEEGSQHAKEFEKYWRSIIDKQVNALNTSQKLIIKRNQAVIGEKQNRNATEEERQLQTKKTRNDLKGTSLTDAIQHTLPNLIYLGEDLKKKLKCGVPRMYDKNIKNLFLTITCEKDMWVAAEVNIHDNLTPLDRSICFLDGRALEDVIGEPDFIVVDKDYEIVIPFEYKTRWTLKIPSNEEIVVLNIQEKKYREGRLTNSKALLSTTQSTKFMGTCVPLNYGKNALLGIRGINGVYDWLRVSDPISNTSTDPTLLKSIAYIIFVASNSRYAPYIDKPKLITDEESSNS
ncbi:63_t:CDS:2, partial [Gigaspora rosea]